VSSEIDRQCSHTRGEAVQVHIASLRGGLQDGPIATLAACWACR
jgi:hypothetical protein